MSVKGVFEKLREALESEGIPYFVSGSFASSAHGIPRSTNDIDIVIAPSAQQLRALLAHFPESEFGVSGEAAFEAMSYRSQFNVVDFATLWKIDFIFRQQTPFDASRFARRGIVDIAGVRLQAASAEDILITKLWWAKLGESERQINDAAGVIQVQGHHLDKDNPAEEENAPRGLSLSIGSIAADGTVTLDLRNYSSESFTFAGTPDQPQLVIEVEAGTTHSRHTVSPWLKQAYELPAGERIQLKAKIGGLSGRLRIGIKSREFGYVVWSEGITR